MIDFLFSITAVPNDIVNIDQLSFHFECFVIGATAEITGVIVNNDDQLEGPEAIGFTIDEASNVPGATAFSNMVVTTLNDVLGM